MDMLIFAQTLFYLVISVLVIFIGVLCLIITLHFILIAKHLHRLSNNLEKASKEVQETINGIIDVLAHLPIMSFLFKKAHSKSRK